MEIINIDKNEFLIKLFGGTVPDLYILSENESVNWIPINEDKPVKYTADYYLEGDTYLTNSGLVQVFDTTTIQKPFILLKFKEQKYVRNFHPSNFIYHRFDLNNNVSYFIIPNESIYVER